VKNDLTWKGRPISGGLSALPLENALAMPYGYLLRHSGWLAAASVCWWSAVAAAQIITAHRGASHDAPENTLAAFELAWKQGADAIEGDFYLTADRQIVCIHDADTLRTTGVKKIVAATPLAELRDLEAGSWKDRAFAGEKLPTFAEVLAVVPADKQFFIELKTGPEIVPVLAEQLRSESVDPQQLLIIGFKQQDDGAWTPSAETIAATVRTTGADGVGLRGERKVLDDVFFAQLSALGVEETHVWTIDDPADARFFRDLGVFGITTNRPQFIRASLQASPALSPR
jgi:glycerophosphoryl diester phosphodiesterase